MAQVKLSAFTAMEQVKTAHTGNLAATAGAPNIRNVSSVKEQEWRNEARNAQFNKAGLDNDFPSWAINLMAPG